MLVAAAVLLMTVTVDAQEVTPKVEPAVVEWTRTGETTTTHERFRGLTMVTTKLKLPKVSIEEVRRRFGTEDEKAAQETSQTLDSLKATYFQEETEAFFSLTIVRLTAGDIEEVYLDITVMDPSPEFEPDADATDWVLVDGKPTEVGLLRRLQFGSSQKTRLGPLPVAAKALEVKVEGVEFQITGDALKALTAPAKAPVAKP